MNTFYGCDLGPLFFFLALFLEQYMDSLTQAALGGALGGAVLGSRLGRGAIVGGALLATLPDLDVLIDYGDAVANFSEHRGFSHSLLVLAPLATLLAWALQTPMLPQHRETLYRRTQQNTRLRQRRDL